jgi:hypothetical protein
MSRFTATLLALSLLCALTAEAEAPQASRDAVFDEMVVLGSGLLGPERGRHIRAFVRAGDGPWEGCSIEGEAAQHAHRTLLRGVIHRTALRRPSVDHACSVEGSPTVVEPSAHALFPLALQQFGPINTLADADEQTLEGFEALHLEVHPSEWTSVQWTALWASDLPDSIIVEGQPTMRGSELRARLEAATRSREAHEIRREELFAPEIADRALRLAIAHTRIYRDPGAHLEVIQLCRGNQRDLRVVHFAPAHNSTRQSWWRAVIRSAVLNHGARPWNAAHPGCDD